MNIERELAEEYAEKELDGLRARIAELESIVRELLIQSPHSEGAPEGCRCRWCKARVLIAEPRP